MYLLYLSSTNGQSVSKTIQTIVRVELMSEESSIIRYYHFKNCGQDQAKLKSATKFIIEHIIPLQSKNQVDLTIYFDRHELAFDYAAEKDKNFTGNKYSQDWVELVEALGELKLMPFVQEKGVLSASMREELQQYIIALKNQCNNAT